MLKALAREAEDRYQWASDLQEDLMRFLLAGDAIYSAKHLGAFMKDAFAEDLLRENEKMERFATVEKPETGRDTSTTHSVVPRAAAAPPPRRLPPRLRGETPAQPSPAISALGGGSGNSGGRRNTQNVAVAGGSGAVAMGMQSSKIDIPPPSEEELAEMDGGGEDRTVMVALDANPGAEDNSTAIGTSPFAAAQPEPTAPAGRQLRPSTPTSGNSTTHDNLKPAPSSRPSVKSLRDLPAGRDAGAAAAQLAHRRRHRGP